jgi:hypothetical protein
MTDKRPPAAAANAATQAVNFASEVLRRLIRDNGDDLPKLGRAIQNRLPGFNINTLMSDLADADAEIFKVMFDYFIGRLVQACGSPEGPLPDHIAIEQMLSPMPPDVRANWLDLLQRHFPWISPDFDPDAWKAKQADAQLETAFRHALASLDDDLLIHFFDQARAEMRRDELPGMDLLAERLVGVCKAMGLPIPPNPLDLVNLAASFPL